MDQAENLRLYLKNDLQKVTYEQKTLMPAFGDDILDDAQLRDLVAYLDGLRGEVAQK